MDSAGSVKLKLPFLIFSIGIAYFGFGDALFARSATFLQNYELRWEMLVFKKMISLAITPPDLKKSVATVCTMLLYKKKTLT